MYSFMQKMIDRIIMETNFTPQEDISVLGDIAGVLQFIIGSLHTLSRQELEGILKTSDFIVNHVIDTPKKQITIAIGNFKGTIGYSPKLNVILLDLDEICKLDYVKLLKVLIHEIHHALSRRSDIGVYENFLEKYKQKIALAQQELIQRTDELKEEPRLRKELHSYIKDPEEFDAIGAEISTKVLLFYCTQENLDILQQWIRGGGNIDVLPDFLKQWKYIIEVWKTKPSLYRRLLLRFHGLALKMKQKLPQ